MKKYLPGFGVAISLCLMLNEDPNIFTLLGLVMFWVSLPKFTGVIR